MKTWKAGLGLVALGLVLSAPLTAELSKAAGATGVRPAVPEGTVVLYDQTDNAADNGSPDQNFEAAYNAYDCAGADDFVVTDPTGWTIEQVVTVGTQSIGGAPASVDVTFYANSPGGGDTDLPGAVECGYPGLTPAGNASFTLTLPSACILGPGTHWVGLVVNQDFGGSGQHFWSNRSVQTGNEGVWMNPGNGFGTGCTSWAPQTTCGTIGGSHPDYLFQIVGQVGGLGPGTVTMAIPTLDRVGFAILLALLAAAAFWMLRRARRA